MKKFSLILSLLMLTFLSATAQERIVDEFFGFSMDFPEGWYEDNGDMVRRNLNKISLDGKSRGEVIENHKGSYRIAALFERNPVGATGIIPTIQVLVRKNVDDNYEDFEKRMVESVQGFSAYFPDIEMEKGPIAVKIGGTKSLNFVTTYTLNTENEHTYRIKSIFYAIPHGDYFFQINFTTEEDDKSQKKLFRKLLKSIELTQIVD